MKKLFFLFLLLSPSVAMADPLEGYWETAEKDSVVEFYPCEDSFCGRFVWLKDDSAEHPSLDDRNTNPSRRGRPLCGMEFLGGFQKEGDRDYTGGWIYSPRHGSSFSAKISLSKEETLTLRGYVFFPALGGEQTWRRTTKPVPCWNVKKEDK